MNYKQFCGHHGITATAEWSAGNPNMDMNEAWARSATHYRITLKRTGDQRRTMTTYFSQGRPQQALPGLRLRVRLGVAVRGSADRSPRLPPVPAR